MKKFLLNLKESYKHNWYLYLLGVLHLAFWLFNYIVVCEVITGNFDVSGIVDLNEVMFSYQSHEYTLFDMWFFMTISVFMIFFINTIVFVHNSIFRLIIQRDYDRQIKSTK